MLGDRLKKYSSANANPANPANVHQQNTQTLATLATLQLEAPAKSEVISNWWLVHFVDHDSVKVAIWPPCNLSDVLGFHPSAIDAEPIPSPIKESLNDKI